MITSLYIPTQLFACDITQFCVPNHVTCTYVTAIIIVITPYPSPIAGGAGLRNLSLWSPRGALAGPAAGVTLRCSYELEGAALYSARWYRHEHEFYRYVPREMPPTMVFPLPGATVDVSSTSLYIYTCY